MRNRLWNRVIPAVAAALLVLVTLAACGGSDPSPTPTAIPAPAATEAPTELPTAVTTNASPIAQRALADGSPVAASSLLTPLTREEVRAQVAAAYPIEPAAQEGGTVVFGESGDISTVNGILTADSPTIYITGLIYETLLGASPIDGRPVPGLADSWDISPDGLTYTFHLNTDATWHDGVDFTADDVAFSFDSVLDPNTGSAYRSIVRDAVASYRVIDPDTFEMTARDRTVTFLYEGPGAVLVMPKHIWESVGTESWSFDGGSTGQDASRVIGTGPFKFGEWVQGDHVTIVRNDDYYDQVPYIDALTMQVLPNADSTVLALQDGQIDIMEIVPPAQMAAVQATDGLSVDIYDFFQFTFYAFNLDPARSDLWQDKGVRQAMFYALDRDAITRNIFLGYGEAAIGTQPPLSPAYAPDQMTPEYTYDPEKAKSLLAEAGWTDSDGNGWLDRDGKELSFKLTYSGGDAVVEQIVAYMQEAWKGIGVRMEPESVAGGAFLDALKQHDFDMALLAVTLGTDGSQTALFSCDAVASGLNFMGYCNDAWDSLDDQQRREFDIDARTQLLVEQSKIVWDDQPVGILRFGVARTGYSDRLHNFYPNGYGFLWSIPWVWVSQ